MTRVRESPRPILVIPMLEIIPQEGKHFLKDEYLIPALKDLPIYREREHILNRTEEPASVTMPLGSDGALPSGARRPPGPRGTGHTAGCASIRE